MLEQNLADLQPRNHSYVTACLTNLPLTFAFNTTTQANGEQELTAVVYEGSHVQLRRSGPTPIRRRRNVFIACERPIEYLAP